MVSDLTGDEIGSPLFFRELENGQDLVDIVEQAQAIVDVDEAAAPRPEILDSWMYNWQTKERVVPKAMLHAGKCVTHVEEGFQNLQHFCTSMEMIPKSLKTPTMTQIEASVKGAVKQYDTILKQLEVKINALRLYWFPETVQHLILGAYKSVQQPVFEWSDNTYAHGMSCSICQDEYSSTLKPVAIIRRCVINPLLEKCCTLEKCQCVHPPLCLNCALDLILRNCIHEGKSSVKCPMCRGEFCIYDIQEISLI